MKSEKLIKRIVRTILENIKGRTIINKVKYVFTILLMTLSALAATGCKLNINGGKGEIDDVNVDVDINDKDIDDIVKRIIKEYDARNEQKTTETTTEETKITYTQSLETTTETVTTTMTNPTIITTTEETKTTETTTVKPVKEVTEADAAFDLYQIDMWNYIEDVYYEFKMNEKMNTCYKFAEIYCPEGMTRGQFATKLQELNATSPMRIGDKIKVPVQMMYVYVKDLTRILNETGTTLEDIAQLNDITLQELEEIKKNNRYKELAVKAMPLGTKICENASGKPLYIVKDLSDKTAIIANKLVQMDDDKYIEIQENNGTNSCYITNLKNRECYDMVDNVKDAYAINNIPVFVARTEEDCKKLASIYGSISMKYETVIKAEDEDIYKIYKDKAGNICFTYAQVDLTKYGYMKAQELASNYYRGDWYYVQDETGIIWDDIDEEKAHTLKLTK